MADGLPRKEQGPSLRKTVPVLHYMQCASTRTCKRVHVAARTHDTLNKNMIMMNMTTTEASSKRTAQRKFLWRS